MKNNHYDVKIYSNDSEKRVFFASFRSIRSAEKFMRMYQYHGGFKHFEYDIYGMNDFCGKIQIIPCNEKGRKIVWNALYGF